MVPVLDVSLIGTLTAIWAACKVLFSAIGKGLDWISKRALAALIGSKFWATAFFCGLAVLVISAFHSIFDTAVDAIQDSVAYDLQFDNDTFTILSYIMPLDKFTSLITFLLSLLASYLVLTKVRFVFRAMFALYTTITRGWKT